MYRPFLLLLLLVSLVQRNACQEQQLQMPDDSMAAMVDDSVTLAELQKNISTLWSYIYELRSSVTHHLNHLRQHQVEMEETIHRMEHHGAGHGDETHASHTAEHSHSGEHTHSHGSDNHSHSGEHHHHHSGEQHSHSGEQHAHSGEQHSHGDDGHSHDGEGHSHGGHADYHSHSHSHSHTEDDHSHSGHDSHDHHHGHDHKDSHENTDVLQQTSQVAEPLVEPVIVPSRTASHRHHGSSSQTSSSTRSSSSNFQPLTVTDGDHHHHHHHHHAHETSRSSNRSRVVIMPKYSEYDLYEFAVCNVKPNRAIPEEQQQNIMGQVAFWQKKVGGHLNIHVRLSGFEMEDHHAHHQQQQQEENSEPSASGHRHGFHVHTNGDLSNGCQSTGPHYNPKSVDHGGPNSLVRHVGDLGNIECDDNGATNLAFSDDVASLLGQYSILGKSLVIHSGVDDFGLGDNEESLRTGNAGTRLACCIIQRVEKLPIRLYKAMKTATQYNN